MMKLTIYVEAHDPHAAAKIDDLEVALAKERENGSLRSFVTDLLTSLEKVARLLAMFGIGGRGHAVGEAVADPSIAGPWANAAGQPLPSQPGMQSYRRKCAAGARIGETIASVVEEGERVFSWYTCVDEGGSAPTLADAVSAADNSLRSQGYTLLGGLLDTFFHAPPLDDGIAAMPTAPPAPSPLPTAPASPPPAVAVVEDVEAAMLKHAAMLHEGEGAFDALTRTWVQNFGVEQAPQPDRTSALMACFTGHGRAASIYIRERGGLAGACIDSIVRQSLVPPDEAVALGQVISLNMVQVGSAIGVPLDTLLEKSMFRRDLHKDTPPPGTLPPGEFDRSHLDLPDGSGKAGA